MAVETNDKKLSELLKWVEEGNAQLPEFQRDWVWDDSKICKLIESVTSGYPMGAAMFLANGGENIRFKYRKFVGVSDSVTIEPEYLVLDGQQRLTTLFQVFKCKAPVYTRLDTKKDKIIRRYYYLDIKKCLSQDGDRMDAIISISDKKKITSEIGRKTDLDLTTLDNEYKNMMFPLNIVFSEKELDEWRWGFEEVENGNRYIFRDFMINIIRPILDYAMPVIKLDKQTSKEAVCQIFENVNTGGVPLTVFELITATFAADEYNLREDWDNIRTEFLNKKTDVLKEVTGANFIAAMTLLVTYKKSLKGLGAISCKKRDVLRLDLDDYRSNHDNLVKGFSDAANFLVHQGIYRAQDLPYTSQLIPLAAIFAFDNEQTEKKLKLNHNIELLSQWYWCGVFGELYGGANEARFAVDISSVFEWINGGETPDTVTRSNFQPTRLLSMQTRNSAAYKGVMALIMQDSPIDFMTGHKMDVASYVEEETDIHHIFPQAHCESNKYPSKKWNSVVNKTPIYASTNRSIGGRAPSEYVKTMKNKGLDNELILQALKSHKINPSLLIADAFDEYFVDRAKQLLNRIEKAIGKAIPGRDSEDTIREFGASLVSNSQLTM